MGEMKPWDECTVEEKRERLHRDLKMFRKEAEKLRDEADEIEADAQQDYERRMKSLDEGGDGR